MTTIDNIETAIKELNAERQALEQKYQSKMQEYMKGLTKKFFEENPQITAFTWTQYTPYFNDGEECTFSRHEILATNCPLEEIEDVRYEEYVGDTEGIFVSNFSTGTFKTPYYKETVEAITQAGVDVAAVRKFINLLGSIDDDVYCEMFGDHVKVIAHTGGFNIEDHEHD